MENFNSLIELIAFFNTEDKCLQYLEQQRWDSKPVCPHCGFDKVYRFSDGKRYKCANCREQFTAKVGTIFEDSKVPLRKWYVAIYLVTSHKKGISSHQLAKDIKVTQKTAWFMLHRIRFALGQGSIEMPMGGGGGIVEIDETYIGGKESNKHENKKSMKTTGHMNKTIVMGLIERTGNVRTFIIPNTEAYTMHPLIIDNVAKDALVITDGHRSYKNLWEIYDNHAMVKTNRETYRTDKVLHTNNIEGYWSLLKRSILGIYHYVSPKHLQAYCDETAYRYNTRDMNEGNRVSLTITQANKTLKYKQLIGK